ncbi:HNH endonuclease signature motif containing protein [Alkalihalophilus marmarensis]|uniref:HNH endonuclease n=1 Tax=Alkalihalophilus marmarensis TaxID=521377 RepID=UPI002E1FA11D|nr:HNH endonuclease signature motif containing protein [Alkalihalophilus marmarensis]
MEYETEQQKKRFYKSKEWQLLRREVLERDNYECQECKRNGRVYTDNHDPDKHKRLDIDHIKEIEDHPELALEIDNLEVLCVKCHNKKHNRFKFKKKENRWSEDERW